MSQSFVLRTMNLLHRLSAYADDDYPIHAPLGSLPTVEMTFQESVRFSPVGNWSDRNMDWHVYDGRAPNRWIYGHVWLGDLKLLFVPVLHHQMHCVRSITEVFAEFDIDKRAAVYGFYHVEHCLNYFRQTLLCRADRYLEKGDFMSRDFDAERIGHTRTCNDWSKALSWLDNENLKYMP